MSKLQSRFRVGLTGGIGSGKSTAAGMFGQLGAKVIDADLIAREVVEPGSPALKFIKRRFGGRFINRDGSLRRAELRRRVFAEPEARAWLEGLLHPLIYDIIVQRFETRPPANGYHMLVSPLLLETGQRDLVKRVLVVDAPPQIQLQRALLRDQGDPETIQAIINAQMERQRRLRAADDVIDNSWSLEALRSEVARLHKFYMGMAKGASTR